MATVGTGIEPTVNLTAGRLGWSECRQPLAQQVNRLCYDGITVKHYHEN